tara:strand:- start:858 stop:1157 length:300 start_codon:yes stop_codon:yes gene_type:complete
MPSLKQIAKKDQWTWEEFQMAYDYVVGETPSARGRDSLEPDLFHVVYVDPTGIERVMTGPDELSALASLLGAHFDKDEINWAHEEALRINKELADGAVH